MISTSFFYDEFASIYNILPYVCIMQETEGEPISKTIALVAHDNRKKDLTEWVEYNYLHLINNKKFQQ